MFVPCQKATDIRQRGQYAPFPASLRKRFRQVVPDRRICRHDLRYLLMLDVEQVKSVASQLMTGEYVEVEGASAPVRRTSGQRLKTAAFCIDGRQYQAIEQNPEKPSRWGQLARSGRQVVQIKDAEKNRFVAVVVDGEVTFYGHSNKRS